jgi:hypothetical protein
MEPGDAAVTVIDLIPPETIQRRDVQRRLGRWGARAGLVVAAGSVFYAALAAIASGQREELAGLQQTYSDLQDQLRRAEGLLQERQNLGRHREAIALIRGGRSAGHYLDAVGATMTPDSYLDALVLERCPPGEREDPEARAPEACLGQLRLQGRARGHEEVGWILRSMIARPEFREVSLVSVTDPPRGTGPDEVSFEIVCVLAETGRTGG